MIYPPGFHLPIDIQKNWNPFLIPRDLHRATCFEDWICNEEIDCLSNLEPITVDFPAQSKKFSSRPLMCSQYPGDILYLPSGWNHMTLNPSRESSHRKVDETEEGSQLVIGIGGQKIWDATNREAQCFKILFSSSLSLDTEPLTVLNLLDSAIPDYECLKSIGNIYKQKANELLKLSTQKFTINFNNYTTSICILLQSAVEFYRFQLSVIYVS